jgi:hypothetical protein
VAVDVLIDDAMSITGIMIDTTRKDPQGIPIWELPSGINFPDNRDWRSFQAQTLKAADRAVAEREAAEKLKAFTDYCNQLAADIAAAMKTNQDVSLAAKFGGFPVN